MAQKKSPQPKPVAPYEILKWIFHEFGFALLLLSFSMGTLALGLGLQNLQRLSHFTSYVSEASEDGVVCELPITPQNVKAREGWEHTGEMVITWQSVPAATSYLLTFGTQSGQYEQRAVNVGNDNQHVLRNLESGKAYYLAVSAANECGSSPYSPEVMAVASGPLQQPGETDEAVVPPVVEPYTGAVPQEMEQSRAVVAVSGMQSLEDIAPFIESLLMVRSYRLLTAGVVLFLGAGLIAMIGMRHMEAGVKHKDGSAGFGFGRPSGK